MNIQVKTEGATGARPLAGKVSLVTGSTSGIGLGIARALAEAGSAVVLNGFGVAAEIAKTRDRIAADFGVKAGYSAADMTKPEAIAEMISGTIAEHGRLDVLVNNAGIQYVAPLEQFPVEKWNAILAINLSSAFHTTRLALPAMRQNKFGRIINIASAHGLVGSPFKAAYVAAKHGIIGLTKVTALETAEDGITCNAICPGYVYTPLVEA
jgi:3-hydroxybutyrate dehydrogenase